MELVAVSKLYGRSVVVYNEQEGDSVQEQVFFCPRDKGIKTVDELAKPVSHWVWSMETEHKKYREIKSVLLGKNVSKHAWCLVLHCSIVFSFPDSFLESGKRVWLMRI